MPPGSPLTGDCPCGSALDYSQCCGLLHAGAPAADASALMRSRYTAYFLGLKDYLLNTWHVSTRPSLFDVDPATRWLGLQVRRRVTVDPTHAQVEFVARFRVRGGSAVRLHELSDFICEDGRWFYVCGHFLESLRE